MRVKIYIEIIKKETIEGFYLVNNGDYDYLVYSKTRNVHLHVYIDNEISYEEIEFNDYYINLETKEIFKASYETDYQSLRANKFIFSKIVGSTRYDPKIIDSSVLKFVNINDSLFSYVGGSIKILKNNYTRDELRNIALNLLANYNVNKLKGTTFDPEKWIEEQL